MKNTFGAISEVIGLAWCDKTSFDDIYKQTGLSEREVIEVMRQQLKPSSFRTDTRTHFPSPAALRAQ